MTREPVVVGVGMMTALGLSAPETAASTRAGLMRFAPITYYDKRVRPFTVASVVDDGLPELAESVEAAPGLTHRERRMIRIGAMPLREALKPLASRGVRPPLVLALPETTTTRALHPAFLGFLAHQTGGAFEAERSRAGHWGRAGGLTAIGEASDQIRSGEAAVVLAGGIDSYCDPYVLGTLDLEGRVKSSVNLDGFIPGEAAGFVLLASRSAAVAAGLTILASVSPVAAGLEAGHLYSDEPYRGEGLAATVQTLVQLGGAPAPIQDVYSSMNGESHWAKEWGVTYIRNRDAFRPDHAMHHPADCFGDTGAACGPLMVGLAAMGISGRYRSSPSLVYASSDRGLRAALTVHAT